MTSSQFADEVGYWKKEKVLGTGGFGYVVLWKNRVTNETIALKECRWGNDPTMTPKHRKNWKIEVDIMLRLNHPNIVTAKPVPPEFVVPPTALPLLAMEFCSKGDLRKLLSKPENCCGLKEKHVRLIMKHISSAVNYLHSRKIIHRDLKPENIVIQEDNESVVYKLTDLGYAKELDQGSLGSSFVGTLQYLAPELFMSRVHSCSVDYWSLGLVTYEIITGTRPFLPEKSPAEWIPIIKQKSSSQIRAYLDEDKNIVFSSEISPFHHITNTFKEEVEKWLRLMLEFDPNKRGRHENIMFFPLLETILNKKIVMVFCVETLKLHSFIVSEDTSLENFALLLEKETKIPVKQQEIILPSCQTILPNGNLPDLKKGVKQFIADLEKEEFIIFLLDSKNPSSLSPSSVTFISSNVEAIMRHPHEKIYYTQQRSAWTEAVHLCQQEYLRASRVFQSFKAYVIILMSKTSAAHKNVSRMTEEMVKLIEKCDFFKCSIEKDIKNCEKQIKKGSLVSQEMLQEWKRTSENLKKIDLLGQKVFNLETCLSNITAHAVELHKSPYARSKILTPVEEVYENVLESYSELRKRSSDERRVPHDNIEFVKLLCLCLENSHKLIQETLSHISKVKKVIQDINECQPQIMDLPYEIAEWKAEVEIWQSQRQQEIWQMVDTLNNKIRQSSNSRSTSPSCSSPQSFTPDRCTNCRRLSGQLLFTQSSTDASKNLSKQPLFPSVNSLSPPIIGSHICKSKSIQLSNEESFCNNLSSYPTSLSKENDLSSLLNQTSEDNHRVKKKNEELLESFQVMMNVLQSYESSGN